MAAELKFEGIIVPMATPFREDGALDEEGLRKLSAWLISKGVNGLYPVSGCGEAPKLTLAEKKRMIEAVVSESDGRVPVLPCTDHGSLTDTLELTTFAEQAGCDGVVVIPPNFWWLKYPEEDILFDYFRRVTGAIDIPVMVYDNGYGLSVNLLERLSKIDNVRALKDSTPDFGRMATKFAALHKRIAIFPGQEPLLLPGLSLGAAGGVCSGFNVYPEPMIRMYRAFREGRFEEARRMHEEFIPLWNAIYAYDEHHAVKEGLAMRGLPVGGPRVPFFEPPMPKERLQELRWLLENAGLLGPKKGRKR